MQSSHISLLYKTKQSDSNLTFFFSIFGTKRWDVSELNDDEGALDEGVFVSGRAPMS